MEKHRIYLIIVFVFFCSRVNAQNALPASGNIGIRTSIPSEALEISGNGLFKIGSLNLTGWSGAPGLGFNVKLDYSGQKYEIGNYASHLYYQVGDGLLLYRTTSSRINPVPADSWSYPLIISKEGKTSIGCGGLPYEPQAKLSVYGNMLVSEMPLTSPELEAFTKGINNITGQKLRLFVNGSIGAKEFRCSLTKWSDNVFEKGYSLFTLEEVENYISAHNHLPEVPSEKELLENGLSVSDMLNIHMKKIEELTLYMIELKKENIKLQAEVNKLKK